MTRVRGAPPAVRGFTLVELIMFIVIMGVVTVAMVQAFSGPMRGSHTGKEMTNATQLAQQRMEVIAGQRRRLGYTGFTAANYDPCQLGLWTTAPCNTTTYAAGSFVVTTTPPVADACGTGCQEVTVTVTDPYGVALAHLTAQFWDY